MFTRKLHRPAALAAAVVTATALALTACGGPSSSSSDAGPANGKVTLWMYPVIKDETASKKFWQDTEAAFEKANPGIDLTIELQTFDKRDAQISAALAAGSGPDVVLITPDQAATYRNVRGLLPVDDAVSKDKNSFYPNTLDAAAFDEQLFGVPLFQNINTTAYNTKIFKDAGLELPKTWDDLRAAAPVLAKQGVAVMDYAGSPEQTLNLSFYPLLWQAGGKVFSDDAKDIAFDSAEGESALQLLVDLKKAGGLPIDAATDGPKVEGAPIATGKAAMRATTSLPELKQMRAALGAENVALGEPLTGKDQATYGNPGLLALTSINKKENRQAAYTVMDYLSSAASQKALNAAAGNLPTREDAAVLGDDADSKAMAAALKAANPGESSPVARQVMGALAPNIQAALRGDLTPKEALAKAATEARGILQRAAR
ncbi:multiple sugar transport system substrate-binding protein [Pseudarthrobacter equi]|uniref:Multiple sugar transport system substrate-binding protein n=1 Tax=Pseudarthrobacter equi TaxID=728066 RepID=A0A1H1YLU1_9MICC|nr:extracellular solute-binding protein [Pseudarthrobacter equi]SDT22427.1 multiple sugar transport system substrate-binding protein [Pseudarthrobacter equi]